MSEDYYALLGVDQAASEEAILQAYREKAAEHHPDVSEADDAESTFQRLHEAKDVLTDEQERREYDRVGHDRYVADAETDRTSGEATARQPSRAGRPGGRIGWPGGFGALLGQFFGGPTAWTPAHESLTSRARSARRRESFVIDLEAELNEQNAANSSGPRGRDSRPGVGRTPERTECPRCKGRGRFVHEIDTVRGRTRRLEPCERCGGSGAIGDPE